MRALVTGATGFVGSHLVDHLLDGGHTVAVLTRGGSTPRRIAHRIASVHRIEGELGAISAARPAILEFAPEVVFHLAWGGVGRSQRGNADLMLHNLNGSVALFRLAAEAGCRTWIGLGSQAEYGPQDRPLDEAAPASPITLYGTVKLCSYRLLQSLSEGAGVRLAWVRLFSAYGPKDHASCLLPQLIEALLQGRRPTLTAGEPLWDYLYVSDAVDALIRIANQPEAAGVFNLGSGRVVSIRSVAERVRDLIDPALPLGLGEVPYRPDQVFRLQADVRRLREGTGWEPRVTLDDGLARTVHWHVLTHEAAAGAVSAA